MKTLALITLITSTLFASSVRAEPNAKATYQDIQKTLGLVPEFLKAFPERV